MAKEHWYALRMERLLIADEQLIIETDLTEEEKEWIEEGRREYAANPQSFKPLMV